MQGLYSKFLSGWVSCVHRDPQMMEYDESSIQAVEQLPSGAHQLYPLPTKKLADDTEQFLNETPTTDTLPDLHTHKSASSAMSDTSSQPDDISCEDDLDPLEIADIELAMSTKLPVQPWNESEFEFVKTLQTAPRNHGTVDLMKEIHTGAFVAVKKMPNMWMTENATTFREMHGSSTEKPWWDLAVLKCLQERRFTYLCPLSGVLRDHSHTYVLTSFATDGDLLSWCSSDSCPKPGKERIAMITPMMRDLFTAVKSLHDLGIAHGDLSLENVVVTKDSARGYLVKIIDFGMSGFERMLKGPAISKPSYTAPEAYESRVFDRFLADGFAVGVMLYGMAANDYIWYSTKSGLCQRFGRMKSDGIRPVLKRRRVRTASGDQLLMETVPESLFDTLVELVALNPAKRLTLGENCWESGNSRPSVWRKAWLSGRVQEQL